jgi:hypothetical protein
MADDTTEMAEVPDLDRSPLEHRTYTPPVSGRFRAIPLPWGFAAAAKHCDRNGGHVLTVRDREIICERCPARWRDEGF